MTPERLERIKALISDDSVCTSFMRNIVQELIDHIEEQVQDVYDEDQRRSDRMQWQPYFGLR